MFQEIFNGYRDGYGKFTGYKTDGTSKECTWVKEDLDISQHLSGQEILGGSPWDNSKGGCRYIGIDIDSKIPPKTFCQAMFKLDPFIFPFMSHSGRWHIYKFFDEIKPIDESIKIVSELATKLKAKFPEWTVDKICPSPGTSKPNDKFPNGSPGNWLFFPYQIILDKSSNKKLLVANCYSPKGNPLSLEQFYFKYQWRNHPLISASVGMEQNDGRHKALFNLAMYLEVHKPQVTLKEIDSHFSKPINPIEPNELTRVTENAKEDLIDNPKKLENNYWNYLTEISGVEFPKDYSKPITFGAFTGDTEGREKFFNDIIFMKIDDMYYDRSTGREYTGSSLNKTYGHLFTNPSREHSKSENKQEVEEGIYRPQDYNKENPIIIHNGLKYINQYIPYKNGYQPIEPTTQQHKDELEWWLSILRLHYPNEEHLNYILDWYSTIYQRPGLKIRHTPIKLSEAKQIGKNMEFDIATGALGDNADVISPTQALEKQKKFLYDKQIVLIDEIKIKGDYSEKQNVMNIIKPIITNDIQDCRPLFKEWKKIITVTSIQMNTNHKDAINTDETEERFSIFKISHNRKSMGGSEFFKPIDCAMKSREYFNKEPSIFGVVAHYLLNRQITEKFEARGTCLKTPWLAEMSEATAHPLETQIKQLVSERKEPFHHDVISISDIAQYFREHFSEKVRMNILAQVFQNLKFEALGECKHKHSGRHPTLYIIRNHELYGPKNKSEIASKCWLPLSIWDHTHKGDPSKYSFSQNPKDNWGMNDYDILAVEAWYRDEVTAFERERGTNYIDDRPLFEIRREKEKVE